VRTVNDDEQGVLSSASVVFILVVFAEEDLILYLNGGQLAGTHANEGIA